MWNDVFSNDLSTYFDKWAELGEMIGSSILTFALLVIMFVAKQGKFGIDSNFKKRVFLGGISGVAIFIGLITAKGFGGHGQINPAITMIVATAIGNFQEVPAIIGFQFIGSIIAVILFLSLVAWLHQWQNLGTMFKFNDQSAKKTLGIELFGNLFWLFPIAGMVVIYLKDKVSFTFFDLAIAASLAKVILVTTFEEFGIACFNVHVWAGKSIVTAIGQKGKITGKELASELSGAIGNFTVGFAAGAVAHPFLMANK